MNEQFLKWLVEQSDRALFIIALAIGGWMNWRNQKRSETQTDSLLAAMKDQGERHDVRMEAAQNKLFENCEQVARTVAMNTVSTDRNTRVLERVEQKL